MNFIEKYCVRIAALAGIVAFIPILGAGFVYDDLELLRDNLSLRRWSFLWEGFLQPMWDMAADPRKQAGGFYRPVGTGAFTLLWHIGGGAAWVFHAASLLFHAACSAGVARIAIALGWRPFTACVAGVLFALHGAHVEPVAWASSLTYLLATFFSLLAVEKFLQEKAWVCATFLGLAMLSQELALGIWLLCFAASFLQPNSLRQALPLLVVGCFVWLLRASAFDSFAAGLDHRLTWYGFELREHPLLEEIALSMELVGRYLAFLIWPWPHAPFHPLRISLELSDWERWLPAALGLISSLAAFGIWVLRGRKNQSLFWGLGFLFAGLVPVLKTSSLGQFPFEERFAYLASTGFSLLLAKALTSEVRHLSAKPLLILFLSLHTASIWATTPYWSTEEKLFEWASTASPKAMISHTERGRVFLTQAQLFDEGSRERYELANKAELAFADGLAINPDEWFVSVIDRHNGNIGLANAFMVQGDQETANSIFLQILGRWPSSPEGHSGVGFTETILAERELENGVESEAFSRLDRAIGHFSSALEFGPHLIEATYGRGIALALKGEYEKATLDLESCFKSRPADFRYAMALASAQFELNQRFFALKTWEAHLAANPLSPESKEIQRTIQFLRQGK